MRFTIREARIGLTGDAPLSIADGRGASLQILDGRVWVTQEGSLDDVFLDAGDRYRFERPGAAVISAEGSRQAVATVRFEGPLTLKSRTGDTPWWARAFGGWRRSAA